MFESSNEVPLHFRAVDYVEIAPTDDKHIKGNHYFEVKVWRALIDYADLK